MALDVKSLVNLLERSLRSYRQLLSILQNEQNAIIQNDHQELEMLVMKKDHLLVVIEKLEKEKQAIVKQFARETGIKSQVIGIESILDYIPGEHKNIAKQHVIKIKSVLSQLKAINFSNSKLLNYSLSFINYMAHSLTSGTDNGRIYTSSGVYYKTRQKSHFEYCL